MSLIVAGRFDTFSAAESAAHALFKHGFVEEDVTLFFVNPRGQHGRYPIGGDEDTDPAARRSPKGAGSGVAIGAAVGAIVGAAIFTIFRPPLLVTIIAAGVGAYIGSLIGAMGVTRRAKQSRADPVPEEHVRGSGLLVAVHVGPENQAEAARVLRDSGGTDIERATGHWQQGRWSDFDPLKPPALARDLTENPA